MINLDLYLFLGYCIAAGILAGLVWGLLIFYWRVE